MFCRQVLSANLRHRTRRAGAMMLAENKHIERQQQFATLQLQRRRGKPFTGQMPIPRRHPPNCQSALRYTQGLICCRRRQLQFLLDRLNLLNTQCTLVCGFAFTSFSADALHDMPYGVPIQRNATEIWGFVPGGVCAPEKNTMHSMRLSHPQEAEPHFRRECTG